MTNNTEKVSCELSLKLFPNGIFHFCIRFLEIVKILNFVNLCYENKDYDETKSKGQYIDSSDMHCHFH